MSSIPDTITGATVAEVTAYAAARGNTSWAALTEHEQDQALLRAWDYLGSLNWIYGVFDDGLPDPVKTAHIRLTLLESETVGILSPEVTRENYLKRKEYGDGALVKEYFPSAPAVTKYPMISRLLSGYIVSSGCNVGVARG